MAAKSMTELPLVVIVGPTASGKTALAVELAERYNGEIICADSRTIYKGMDIGTAKPSKAERSSVPHWGLDLVEPGDYFSVADFKRYTLQKISEIRQRGRVPFLVGGTGLYIDAVLFDYQFGPPANPRVRETFSRMTVRELQHYCKEHNVSLPENHANKRYLIRAIEQHGVPKQRQQKPISTSIIVGIATDRVILRNRIAQRAEQLFDNGVVREATLLGKKYGWESEAMTGNIYPLIRRYLNDELTLENVKEKFTTLDWRLAKRQLTYLRRNQFIHWLSLTEARRYLVSQLANE